MKIRELMKVPVTSIRPDETVAAAIQKLIEYDRGSISVCNEKGELVGIISERDIVRKCFARNCDVANTRIEDVMSTGVAIGTPEDALEYAVSVM
jgi:CBS domain-containing protein